MNQTESSFLIQVSYCNEKIGLYLCIIILLARINLNKIIKFKKAFLLNK